LPGLASNHDPPDLCLLRNSDYRNKPSAPSSNSIFEARKILIAKCDKDDTKRRKLSTNIKNTKENITKQNPAPHKKIIRHDQMGYISGKE
jgi:hypothetical protein